eukprot:8576803-Heterocapsa_arctica.AAC.1
MNSEVQVAERAMWIRFGHEVLEAVGVCKVPALEGDDTSLGVDAGVAGTTGLLYASPLLVVKRLNELGMEVEMMSRSPGPVGTKCIPGWSTTGVPMTPERSLATTMMGPS